ncbi:hypothetical protein [Neorhodopirellula pilleata]|uniref:Carboxypeptidase regulatory-like domain-containing protein n=1 Tax=Neorhodopirellula pilleata TaxID=2714738 RepID=A0A5C6A6R3_9BACT|nr:hypothetical protein [Neorhodopirellula pilleata]TWT95672.1 hypothetical protein Pla100_33130 [Neorhodopirellula pilleata]
MKRITIVVWMVAFGTTVLTGCSDEAVPIVGGTLGTMTSDGKPMSQMELTFYPDSLSTDSPIAYGAVQSDGSFELVNAARNGAINLEAGHYRVTVESLGADVEIPPHYADPGKTKLRIEHVPPAPIAIEAPGLSKGM